MLWSITVFCSFPIKLIELIRDHLYYENIYVKHMLSDVWKIEDKAKGWG